MKTLYVKPADVEKKWYLIDAEGQRLGKVAVATAKLLRGKHKPEFVPHQDLGDFVVIINAEKAELTGGKEDKKKYYRHSGYPGGLTVETYREKLESKPTFPMERAVKGMLPKNRLGRELFRHVKIYAGAEHPHAAQKVEKFEL